MPASAAAAVSATGTAAVVASAAANPLTASKGANLANIAGVADCAYSDDSLEPSAWAVIIPVGVGEGKGSSLVGGVVVTLGFTIGFQIVNIVLSVAGAPRRPRRVLAIATGAVACYMLPSTASFAMTLMRHGEDGRDSIVGFAGLAAAVLAVVIPAGIVQIQIARQFGHQHMASARTVAAHWAYPYLVLAEGCKDTRPTIRRQLFAEDILVAVVIGAIAGFQPLSSDECGNIGIAMLVVASLHFLYAILVRPFESLLDTIFAILIALGQVLLCICALVAVNKPNMAVLVGYLAVLQTLLFVLQTVAMVGLGIVHRLNKSKKRKIAQEKVVQQKVTALEQKLFEQRGFSPASQRRDQSPESYNNHSSSGNDDNGSSEADQSDGGDGSRRPHRASHREGGRQGLLQAPTAAATAKTSRHLSAIVEMAAAGGMPISGPLRWDLLRRVGGGEANRAFYGDNSRDLDAAAAADNEGASSALRNSETSSNVSGVGGDPRVGRRRGTTMTLVANTSTDPILGPAKAARLLQQQQSMKLQESRPQQQKSHGKAGPVVKPANPLFEYL